MTQVTQAFIVFQNSLHPRSKIILALAVGGLNFGLHCIQYL